MVPFQEDSAVLVEENTDIPDYLPEEESPSQEQDKAVTRVGSITDGMGWLSTAANFLTRSFYWWPFPVHPPPLCATNFFSSPIQAAPLQFHSQCRTSLELPSAKHTTWATCEQQVLDCQVQPAITQSCVYIELQIPLLALCAQLYTSCVCILQSIARGLEFNQNQKIVLCFTMLTHLTGGRRA